MGVDVTAPPPLKVEFQLGGIWTDVTSSVLQGTAVTISHGRGPEAPGPTPTLCKFTLYDPNGDWSPRNPMGAHFGQLGQNTPMRVSVTVSGSPIYRFFGELTSLEPGWDLTHKARVVDVEAGSVLRRLTQRDTPEFSSMRRGYLFETTNVPIAYWPCEDGKDASAFASAYANQQPLQIIGDVKPATDESFPASLPLPQIGTTGALYAAIPSYVYTGQNQLRFLLAVPSAGAVNNTLIATVVTSGTLQWALYYTTGGGLRITAIRNSDNVSVLDMTGTFALNGRPVMVSLELKQNGTGIDWAIATLDASISVGGGLSGTLATQTLGYWLNLTMVPGGMATGHVTVQTAVTSLFDLFDQLKAYAGERAGTRFVRLCTSRGISAARIGNNGDTLPMGPQLPKTLLELLTEVVTVDNGELRDSRSSSALIYRDAASMLSQAAQLTLTYAGHQVAEPLQPVDDDRALINDVTAKRQGGGDYQVSLDTGALSTQAPPNGVGRYDKSITVNVSTEEQLPHAAGWLLHVGTADESRYPAVRVDLTVPDLSAADVAAVLNTGVGDRIAITNMAAAKVYDDLSQLVRGYTETIGSAFKHAIVFNCVPERPWRAALLDDTVYGRLDSDTSTLGAGISSAATSLTVATATGPLWTTASGDRPFDIVIGGERMTVTNVTGAASPQTFTVTRAVNGVVKAHGAGESVHVANPVYIGP